MAPFPSIPKAPRSQRFSTPIPSQKISTPIPELPLPPQNPFSHLPIKKRPFPCLQNLQSPSSSSHSTPPHHQKLQNPPSSHPHDIHNPNSGLALPFSQSHTYEKRQPDYGRVERSSDKELRAEKNEGSRRNPVRPSPPQAESLIISKKLIRLAPQQNKVKKELSITTSLSKKEIEADFLKMGLKLPRHPKKRPKKVQKSLDPLYPGTGLSNITLDSYNFPVDPDRSRYGDD